MDLIDSSGLFVTSMDTETCGGYPSILKAGMQRHRLESAASTIAPNSAALSFTASPAMSPEFAWEAAEPAFLSEDFVLPAAEEIGDEEMSGEPVSRVASPAHKVARLGGASAPPVLGMAKFWQSSEPMPVTPRAQPDSPRTPPSRVREAPRSFTPPPLIPKSKRARPWLLQALQSNSEHEVHAALLANPGDATEPFWEHDCEPPICAAVRLQCSSSIVKLLLVHGADSQQTDTSGRNALQIVKQKLAEQHKIEADYQSVCAAMTMANAHDLLPFPNESGMLFRGLPSPADETKSWCREVSVLLDY